MIANLSALGLASSPLGLLLAVLAGGLLGHVLVQTGLGTMRGASGWLSGRDFAYPLVLLAALLTAMLLWRVGVLFGALDPALEFGARGLSLTSWGAAGLLAGIGFGLGGWCPISALAGLACGRLSAGLFLLGTMGGFAGMGWLLHRFGWSLPETADPTMLSLPEYLHLAPGGLVLGICLAGAVLLLVLAVLRRHVVGMPLWPPAAAPVGIALCAALLAWSLTMVPEPAPASAPTPEPASAPEITVPAPQTAPEADSTPNMEEKLTPEEPPAMELPETVEPAPAPESAPQTREPAMPRHAPTRPAPTRSADPLNT